MMKDLSDNLDKILLESDYIYMIFDRKNIEGHLVIKKDEGFFKVGVKNKDIELIKVEEDAVERRENISVLETEYKHLERVNKKFYKMDIKTKENSNYFLLYTFARLKEYLNNELIYYDIEKGQIRHYNKFIYPKKYLFINKEYYDEIERRILDLKIGSKIEIIESLLEDYCEMPIEKLGVSFIGLENNYNSFYNIISNSKLKDKDKKEYQKILIYSLLKKYDYKDITKFYKFFSFLQESKEVDGLFFQTLFHNSNLKIKVALRMASVKAIENLDLLEGKTNLKNFSKNDIHYLVVFNFKDKDKIFSKFIKNDLILSLDKEIIPSFKYLDYLLTTVKDNYNSYKEESIVFLKEAIKLLKMFDLELGFSNKYMNDLVVFNDSVVKPIEFMLNYKNTEEPVGKFVITSLKDRYLKNEAFLKTIKGINIDNDDILYMTLILGSLDKIDMFNTNDLKDNIKVLKANSLNYNNLQDLLEIYLKSSKEERKLIETLKDYNEIKEDLKFFNKRA